MHSDLKTYKNKNIGQFTSIPLKLSAGAVSDANLDSLYLATHFHKLRTQTVAHARESKHYATTLAAWQKKLKGVDVSDLAAVAKTLGLNVEVFNPLASSEPQTLFSGGGRSKRKAQLLKVKKGVFKPMRAGAIIDELPPDMLRDVVGRLDPQDQSALLDVSRGVREDTMAVLPAQEKLWAAAKILSVEDAKTALEEGARVNKIEPSVGMNVLKMMEGKNGSEALDDYLKRQGGTPLNLEQINKHLARCVKAMVNIYDSEPEPEPDSDEYYPYTEDYYVYDILNEEFEQVREALLDGADANTRTKYDYDKKEGSLLHALTVRAIEFDNAELIVDTIKLLSSFDIDMNQVDMNHDRVLTNRVSESTALHYACSVGESDQNPAHAGIRPSIVKALLESGIDVNKQNSRGCTALHDLAQYPSDDTELLQEDVSLARLLLSHGADVSIKDEQGKTVIDYTDEEDYVTYDPVMLDVLTRATEKREDFIQAVKDGNVESVKQFLREVVPVNTKVNIRGETPLHVSARNGHDDVVQALIEKEADVNAKANDGSTPLHSSAANGHQEVVRALIRAGADVNAKTDNGWTPLHWSAYAYDGHLEVVQALIEAGADVNVALKNGYTALSFSARNGHPEVSRVLIEAGAEVNGKNEDGWTALLFSARTGQLEVARALIEKGADVNAKDVGDFTPLHWSAGNGHLEISKFLIEAGADVNARDSEGRTPLDIDPRLAEFQRNGVRPRQGEDDDQGQGRNVRQRVGGGGNTGEGVDFNADSRGTNYSEDDTKLAKAIEVLFRKMSNLSMKDELRTKLLRLS